MLHLSKARTFVLLASLLGLTGCLFRSRKVEREATTTPLKSATQQELIDQINQQAEKIQTLQATVDIDTSVGGIRRGKVTDYQEIRGYVLARKPAMLRMIGLLPVVRNRAFDMVSDGKFFKLWIPPKNRFVTGRNDREVTNPKMALENVRPQSIYEALLINPIEAGQEIAVLENSNETVLDSRRHRVDQPAYELLVLRQGAKGWFLSRKIIFSRTDLEPHRQLIYDQRGDLVTDVKYEQYSNHDGIWYPGQTEIWRPAEEYDITLNVVKLELNKPLKDEQFELAQPPGAEVVRLGETSVGNVAGDPPSAANHKP
jgi:outer membrane lipoprotein-sorting protein